ncbi:Oxidoreductase [Rhodococcus sp. RD6.2]|uniref:FAD/NAD(P)-binding protein n=1 Tax=Rhodococcus sp. RD6.2 TaxID=260936 RepID=UPI00063B5E2B|nr:FAD/NAD(P)-binding protein [Rhodococcus sp. RD6.2]CRK51228.1 Oxidoreductase [Rhodococcus sp. RD6.2]
MTDAADPMVPTPYRVRDRTTETHDSVTLSLVPVVVALPHFVPGQFMMLAAAGVGEIALSISGDPAGRRLQHTVRAVGAVSSAIHDVPVGSVLGVRGPFGTGWDLGTCVGRDVVIVAGGAGLAAVRSAVLTLRSARADYRRVVLVVGARDPAEFLFRDELKVWATDGSIEVEVTVDQPSSDWDGPVGFVTEPLGRLDLDPGRTTALMCGPEPMMRFAARVLVGKGIPASDIRVSLERNMQCGTALCGHCQLGELLLCRDGPVVDYAVAGPLLHVREL